MNGSMNMGHVETGMLGTVPKRTAKLAIALVAALSICVWMVGALSAQEAWALTSGSMNAPKVGQTFNVDGSIYKITDIDDDGDDYDEVKLVKYGSSKKQVAISKVAYNGITYKVDAIGKKAFDNEIGHKITKLVLGDSVDEIEANAFKGCSKLKLIDMRHADVIDIDKGKRGYYLDDIDIGKNAFKNAGTASVKVKCGKANADYRKLYKKALMKKGMRSGVQVVK